jgi:hypothetical protein
MLDLNDVFGTANTNTKTPTTSEVIMKANDYVVSDRFTRISITKKIKILFFFFS